MEIDITYSISKDSKLILLFQLEPKSIHGW